MAHQFLSTLKDIFRHDHLSYKILYGLVIFVFLKLTLASAQSPQNMIYQPVLGVEKVLFIRINYPDNDEVVLSDERAPQHAEVVKKIIDTISYGKLKFEIDITPVLTMPQPITYYDLDSRLSFVRVIADAVRIAEEAGYDVRAYDREAIFSTVFWPQPFTGTGGFNQRTLIVSLDNPALTLHELGHTFDWRHASFWRVEESDPLAKEGELIEYGDKYDMMGDFANPSDTNPWNKLRAGWINPENILTVRNSGKYIIRALQSEPLLGNDIEAYKALRIRSSPDSEYWVYFRNREEFAKNGALISVISPRNNSPTILLDMNPGSMRSKDDYKDAALEVGKTFHDEETGIEITVLGIEGDSLLADVVVQPDTLDLIPVIDIISPEPRETQTGEITYEATAFDPDVGNINGMGIDTVRFILGYPEGNNPYDDSNVFIPVATRELTSPPYVMKVESVNIPDEAYRIFVEAVSYNGNSNIAVMNHIIDNTGPSVSTSTFEFSELKTSFRLKQNYPNPFSHYTTIDYSLKNSGIVELAIFDSFGRMVNVLVNDYKTQGEHSVMWDGQSYNGNYSNTGFFYYRLRVGDEFIIKKMVSVSVMKN